MNLDNKLVIGHVGRFHPSKNHSYLIKIFKRLSEKRKNCVLLLVGEGEMRESIESQVIKSNLSQKVTFTGEKSDVNELMQAMDILVMPSLYEGLPVTLIEAQANGLRCLVSDRISKEAGLSELVRFIPLEKGVDYWAEVISNTLSDTSRRDVSAKLIAAGYEASETAKWLESYYYGMINIEED